MARPAKGVVCVSRERAEFRKTSTWKGARCSHESLRNALLPIPVPYPLLPPQNNRTRVAHPVKGVVRACGGIHHRSSPKTKNGHANRPQRGQQAWPVVQVHNQSYLPARTAWQRSLFHVFCVHRSRGDPSTPAMRLVLAARRKPSGSSKPCSLKIEGTYGLAAEGSTQVGIRRQVLSDRTNLER